MKRFLTHSKAFYQLALSPMSYGRLTKMRSNPSKYDDAAEPNRKDAPKIRVLMDRNTWCKLGELQL